MTACFSNYSVHLEELINNANSQVEVSDSIGQERDQESAF